MHLQHFFHKSFFAWLGLMQRLGIQKRLDLRYHMYICIRRKKLGIFLVHVHKSLATAILDTSKFQIPDTLHLLY